MRASSALTLVCSGVRSVGERRTEPSGGLVIGRGALRGSAMYATAMVRMTIEVPEGALSSLRLDPDAFAKELRLAAAIKWYELGEVSQGRAAEIAGISRQELLAALGRYRVSPFQYTPAEILEDAEPG